MFGFQITQDNEGQIGTANSLHEACKKIVGIAGGNVTCERRLVAYWNGSSVRPGFGALKGERVQIEEDAGLYV
jgi:hypothetical protein